MPMESIDLHTKIEIEVHAFLNDDILNSFPTFENGLLGEQRDPHMPLVFHVTSLLSF